MYTTTASNPSDLSYANGNLSPPSTKPAAAGVITPGSESSLSEPVDLSSTAAPLLNGGRHGDGKSTRQEKMESDPSQDEDALGSDDPDFDMETTAPGNAGSPGDAVSSSQGSPRQRKRKAGPEHEDYMQENPELYGLRRSVGHSLRNTCSSC